MGKKEQVTRLVLDTNVLVSALLFRSETSGLLESWRRYAFRLAVSDAILDEYWRVLTYPRFRLSEQEIASIMEQLVLPFCDRFEPRQSTQVCSDPDDDKFFHCASAAQATALVSGDRAILSLRPRYGSVLILTVKEALLRFCR